MRARRTTVARRPAASVPGGFVLLLVTVLAIVSGVPGATTVLAQQARGEAPEEGEAAAAPEEAPASERGGAPLGEEGPDEEDLDDIDQLLEGEEEILAGEGYAYDPGNRRDPFKSLLAATELPEFRGPRPEGIPGLLIDEVILTGIFRTDEGYVAQVQSAENEKSYLLKQGDELYDGDVVRITSNEVIFKQIVQDPTALKPFREVVKTLNPERG